jgi:hypothetical protein
MRTEEEKRVKEDGCDIFAFKLRLERRNEY